MFFFFLAFVSGGFGEAKEKKHRCVLPDGKIVWATKKEMQDILARLASEFNDPQRILVPSIRRERKTASLPEETQFPAIKPEVRMLKITEVPQFSLDTEAMLRAYVEGERLRMLKKSEAEWLLILVQ